jgi:chalcone isomerase
MAVSEVAVDGVVFPPVARPPGSGRSHFLAGAGKIRSICQFVGSCKPTVHASGYDDSIARRPGVRGMEIGGNFIKFTAIGVYVEDAAVPALAKRWAGKTADELASDVAFFRDVVTGK